MLLLAILATAELLRGSLKALDCFRVVLTIMSARRHPLKLAQYVNKNEETFLESSMSIYDYTVTTIDGESKSLGDYRDRAMLIVNVASKCGFTPQYKGLEALYRKYKDQGFEVLGFPCNQFGAQEPGSEAEIKQFCSLNYDVTFPMFSKVDVNGNNADPLYKYLKSEQKGLLGTEAIKWNFTKFLVDKSGNIVKRYGSNDSPESIDKAVAGVV